MKFTAIIAAVSCFILGTYASTHLRPDKKNIWLLEGSSLELKCDYKYKDEKDMGTIEFKKGNTVIPEDNKDGYKVVVNKKVEGGDINVWTKTLTKPETTISDQGEYSCVADQTVKINVNIFKVKQENATLNETVKMPIILRCEADINPSSFKSMSMSWVHNNVTLKNDTSDNKYTIFNNGTLAIDSPVRADMGFYYCVINLVYPSDEQHTVRLQPVSLKAAPKVEKSDNPKNMVQGDELELKCEVTGHPFPDVMWLKDGLTFNATQRIHFLPYKGSPSGKVQIYSLDFPDEGEYKCVASAPGFQNATASMKVTVKDKLAALWPFLGIVAEVVILCVIILLYEKKRSKNMSNDDDAQDNNMDNTVDHKDVRHRRT